jgi:AAA domain, putative AbiEii toxin, Type IV TA system/AAA domain
MWIKIIKLLNIRCFDDIVIDFNDKTGNPQKFTLILGENGAGKSTILKAIAITLTGPHIIPILIPDGRQWVREGKNFGSITATIMKSSDDPDIGFESIIITLRFFKEDRTVEWNSNPYRFPEKGWLAAAYGPYRVPPTLTERKEFYDRSEDPRVVNVINLFNPRSTIISIDSWLKELDYERYRQNTPGYTVLIDAIDKLFPPDSKIQFSNINKEGLAMFNTPYGETSLDGLSDGYRSMLIWISHLLKSMMIAFPDSKNLLDSTGILLLDELDAHLHPRWQRRIVSQVVNFFPNLQIITTTHSPLVLQGIKEGKVIVCKRENNYAVLEDLPTVEGWRADELLEESEFFGVNVYDQKTQGELDKHRQLISKKTLSSDEKTELINLSEKLQSKRVVESVSSDLDLDLKKYKLKAEELESLNNENDSDGTTVNTS